MKGYIIKRILLLIPIFLVVTSVTFILLQLIPGDPVSAYVGANPGAPPELYEKYRRMMGLDQPVHIQYFSFIWRVLHGDLGINLRTQRPVLVEILELWPRTMALAVLSMIVALAIAIPIGTISAYKQYSWIDTLSVSTSTLAISLPNFWLGFILMLIFGYYLKFLPLSGWGSIAHLIMPSLALGTMVSGWILRLTRSSMLEVLRQDYVTTAKSKGLSERVVVFKHAFRNAILPVITMIGVRFGYLLGGAVVIEQVFAYYGLGLYTLQGIYDRNYPVVMGSLVVNSMLFAVVNLITDILYCYFDPRISLGEVGSK